jgi:hypothetical protein
MGISSGYEMGSIGGEYVCNAIHSQENTHTSSPEVDIVIKPHIEHQSHHCD